jgi:outer membrane protein assembly factor BamB
VVALDIADGSRRWRQPLYDTVSAEVSPKSLGAAAESATNLDFDATPLVTPDHVYVQSSYGLHGLNPRDGTEAWRIALSTYVDDTESFGLSGGLAVASGHVWASYGNRDATLFEVEIDDGDPEVWMDAPPEDHVRRPVVTGDDPYAAALLAGFSGTTGDELPLVSMSNWGTLPDWSSWGFASVDHPTRFAPLASDGTQYILTQLFQTDGELVLGVVALHRRNGGIEWTAREAVQSPFGTSEGASEFFEHTTLCHPLIAGDTVITGYGVSSEAGTSPTRGMLLGYDVTTGQRRWQLQTDIAPVDLALGGDQLYVGGRGGLLGLVLDSA